MNFSKGYYFTEFNEASSSLTTLNNPFGGFRFTKYHITWARGAFQYKVDTIFNIIDFCIGIADDMIIQGEETDRCDHDKHLTIFVQVTRQYNMKLNIDKVHFKTKQASFFGNTFTSDGHKQENDMAQAINKMLQPTNVRDF